MKHSSECIEEVEDYKECLTCRYLDTVEHHEPCVDCKEWSMWRPNVKLYEFLERYIAEEASEC